MQDLNRKIRIKGAQYGAVLGVSIFLLNLFSYFLMTKVSTPLWMTAFSPLIFTNILPIVIAILLCLQLREKIGGYWTLQQAASGVFMMFFTSYFIFFFSMILYSKVIDPAMGVNIESKIEVVKAAIRRNQNTSEQHIHQETAALRKDFNERQNSGIWGYVQSFGIVVLLLFLASLIFGALFKNEEIVSIPSNKKQI